MIWGPIGVTLAAAPSPGEPWTAHGSVLQQVYPGQAPGGGNLPTPVQPGIVLQPIEIPHEGGDDTIDFAGDRGAAFRKDTGITA
jgi:hypothetical protein